MAKHAFIIGGTGRIGRALALRFRTAGWDVTVSHRGQRGIPAALSESGTKFVILDREQPGALLSALRQGADAVIDTAAYDETHAAQLLHRHIARRVRTTGMRKLPQKLRICVKLGEKDSRRHRSPQEPGNGHPAPFS